MQQVELLRDKTISRRRATRDESQDRRRTSWTLSTRGNRYLPPVRAGVIGQLDGSANGQISDGRASRSDAPRARWRPAGLSGPADRDRLDDSEASDRSGRQRPGLELVLRAAPPPWPRRRCTRLRRATAVSRAARFTGGPKTSPSRIDDRPVASPIRTSGIRGSRPITSMMPSAVSNARIGSSFTKSTESPMLLIIRPSLGGDDVGAAGLEDLDEVAEPVVSSWLDSAVKLDDVGEPDGDLRGVEVLLVGAERLDPAHRGGEVPAPDVDQELLERLGQRRRPSGRARRGARPGRRRRRPRAPATRCTAADLPVGQPGHGLPDRPGQADRHVEVDDPSSTTTQQGRHGVSVGLGEARARRRGRGNRAPATAGAPGRGSHRSRRRPRAALKTTSSPRIAC